MGTLLYGNPGVVVTFDDRALMHLQIVITTKLRRREGFIFSWTDAAEDDTETGRSAIWLDPSSTLYYRYSGGRVPGINREWIEKLMVSANSAGGLFFSAEPAPVVTAPVPRTRS
jgi:hypothetical protein